MLELLELTGRWTDEYYGSVDLQQPCEPVGWFGGGAVAPIWQAIAREYAERWVHHHQILRAVGRPPVGDPLQEVAEHIALAGGGHRMGALGAEVGDEVEVRLGARPWTLRREESRWDVTLGAPASARATIVVAADEVPAVLTRGPHTAAETTTHDGDLRLAGAVAAGLVP